MASIRRVTHKNGRVVYRIVICLGYNENGGKLVKNLTCTVNQSATPKQQEKEALKYALNMEDKLKYGYETDSCHEYFEAFAERWLESVKDSLARGTYIGYENLLRTGILPYFKGYKLACVRTPDIEAFYRTLAGRYAPGTIKRYANVMNCIFKTARRWNLIEDNPCQYARKPRKRPANDRLRYFTPDQSLMFLKSLNLTYTEAGDGPGRSVRTYTVSTQFKVFYMLSLFCGSRKGETLALQWSDIDFMTQEISITKSIGRTENGFDYKEPKSSASMRRIPFPDCVTDILKRYRLEYDALKASMGSDWAGKNNLFIRTDGRLMGQTTAYQHFIRHLERYNQWIRTYPERARAEGLEELPAIPLHGLRHSCATLLNYLEVNIIDISKYLGHASCSTTMNIYAHSFEAQRKAAQEKINAFLRRNED
ncbi:MAG: site-specific integrase [Acetatifactor sp.]|nr:site-specific integrase [Acetatifactor sp.]